jgi:hypothetical protein
MQWCPLMDRVYHPRYSIPFTLYMFRLCRKHEDMNLFTSNFSTQLSYAGLKRNQYVLFSYSFVYVFLLFLSVLV